MTRIGGKSLRDLSDAELQAELERRRRARGYTPREPSTRATRSTPVRPRPDGSLPGWKVRENLRQWYRALELEEGASLEDVEASYRRLLERYDPDRHRDDPEKFRDATKLAVALGEAYYGLRDHLRDRAGDR